VVEITLSAANFPDWEKVKLEVKQPHYRPREALRVSGG
jgi:hypothetical protein